MGGLAHSVHDWDPGSVALFVILAFQVGVDEPRSYREVFCVDVRRSFMCLTGFFYVTDSPDTIQYVTITKVSLLQSCMNTNSKTLPPAATIHTPAEPIHSPITRSRSAVRKDRAKPRTPCKQSRALDIPSRRDEGPAPSTARFRAGRSAADLSAFKAALQRVLGCVL